MRELNLKPGRTIGVLLDSIEEAQAAGEITAAGQALAFARQQLSAGSSEEQG
jgi:hypothetical protein